MSSTHDHHSTGASAAGIAQLDLPELYNCVHCGLCLDQCPTYRALRLEPESPRGRIHLVKAAADGRIGLTERFKDHIYLCLLCRACETACPSGVQYGRIAETAREQLGPPGSRLSQTICNFAFKRLLPNPRLLRLTVAALRFYQRSGLARLARALMPQRLRDMEAMLPPIPDRFFTGAAARAHGPRRARVAMLNGCVMPLLFGDINQATVRVLQRNGCDVTFPSGQGCCGALNLHNGEQTAAKAMARRNIDAFLAAGVDAVIVNAAGCGAAMKEYAYLLRDDPDYSEAAKRFSAIVKDAGEFLAGLGLAGKLGRLEVKVTYQDPCHLVHGQRIRSQPRQLLGAIPGLELVELIGADRCCGSAGIYNITHPDMSRHLLEEKMAALRETGAAAIVVPNPGCMLQLRHGANRFGPHVTVYHLMDLLERSYAAADADPKP